LEQPQGVVALKHNSLGRKISNFDKFQALRRKPSYRADYRDFQIWYRENHIDEGDYLDHPEATKKAEELCRKYGIVYLFNPSFNIPKHSESDFFIEQKEIVEVIYPTEYRDLTEDEVKRGVMPRFLPIPIFSNGDELILKIDLTADKDNILENIIEKLNYYQWFVFRENSRMTSDRKVDKWKVYDTYNQTKSFKKVVQKLNARAVRYVILNDKGMVKAPQKLNISTVRKAYYRAFELVYNEKYDPEKHNPKRLPVKLRRTCDKCPEYATCKALCPEVREYALQEEKYQRDLPTPDQKLDILSAPRSGRKAPKPRME